jgi:hypothetical protein
MDKDKKELVEQYQDLDRIGAIVDRILRYEKILKIKDESDLTDEERLWLLASAGLNLEFKKDGDDKLMKSAKLCVIVESFIPTDYK